MLEHEVRSTVRKGGRPRDTGLTQRLLAHAGDLMIEHGIDAVTPDALARTANAGKASIYRRWPGGMADIMVELVAGTRVVPLPDPCEGAPSQVRELLTGWMVPLSRSEEIVASVLGTSGTHPHLGPGLRARLDDDLEHWWLSLVDRGQDRSEEGDQLTLLLLRAVLIARLRAGPVGQDVITLLEQHLLRGVAGP